MADNYISSPNHPKYMEEPNSEVLGKPVNFRKTFNLNGTENDDMLREYLRKAGLSDEIECLSPEQRRAFIYDIIKSNKMPGHWMPSTMNTTAFSRAPPAVRPPPPPPNRTTTSTSSTYTARKNEPTTFAIHYATMSASSSSGSLTSLANKSSPSMPHRFVAAPATPPSPSTFVTSSKGSKLEISSPMNFVHIAGDMTRDMTRNAFDLSAVNDNVLKKYMIEKGISDEDVSGMRKPDLIRKIVQSKFTWMPPKRNIKSTNSPNVVYATISKNNVITPPPSPQPTQLPKTPDEAPVSNFTLITSRFADPSEFPSPNDLFGFNAAAAAPLQLVQSPPPPPPPQVLRPPPPPPPRTSNASSKKSHAPAPPPPPSAVTATPNSSNIYRSRVDFETEEHFSGSTPVQAVSKTHAKSAKTKQNQNMLTMPLASIKTNGSIPPPPPPPPPPVISNLSNDAVEPPLSFNTSLHHHPTSDGDPRDALLESIRKGAVLKGTSGKSFAPPKPKHTKITVAPVPKKSVGSQPPPPPAMPQVNMGTGALPPPPPPPVISNYNNNANGVPPPPPLMPLGNTSSPSKSTAPTGGGGDPRNALLDSIRKGAVLKKVDRSSGKTLDQKMGQKAATISGVKPRAEQRPPPVDFLAELRMGLTLRRAKNPENNPYAGDEPDESNA